MHIGLVHDEYGVFQGVVTSADILEAIVGSFHTKDGPAESAAVRREDGSYLISGWMPAVEFAELLGITLPTSRQYQTFAGFLLNKFGAIPNVGDKIEVEGWRFEIVDLDGRRIDKALASRLEHDPSRTVPRAVLTSGLVAIGGRNTSVTPRALQRFGFCAWDSRREPTA